MPFPVSFLHVLPARPSRHTQLVETQLSTIKVRAQAWFPPLLEPAFKAACSPTLPQPGWQRCMFPSCLPLCFNAKVLAKDIFLLFFVFQHSVLHCGLGSPPSALGSVPWPGPFTAQGLWGSWRAGLLSLFVGLAKESSICALKILILLKRIEKRNV